MLMAIRFYSHRATSLFALVSDKRTHLRDFIFTKVHSHIHHLYAQTAKINGAANEIIIPSHDARHQAKKLTNITAAIGLLPNDIRRDNDLSIKSISQDRRRKLHLLD
ncbi:unnamed protein product [Penicillium discolor]